MNESKRPQSDKVLAFEQGSEYFRRRAQQMLDKYDLWGALANLRRACQKDPDNAAHRLDTAEVLAQMGLYELSNELIYTVVTEPDKYPEYVPEGYFALGCNYYALKMTDLSAACIANYIEMAPDGEFADDSSDMMALLEEERAAGENTLQEAGAAAAADGRDALDDGYFDDAVSLLTDALAADPDNYHARTDLALAYFCKHEIKRAVSEISIVLKSHPNDIAALCNLAIFKKHSGDSRAAQEALAAARSRPDPNEEEQYKICMTMAELGHDAEVVAETENILRYSPFDEHVLFVNAVANYNTDGFRAAHKAFSQLLLIDPLNSIYRFGLAAAGRALAGAPDPRKLEYVATLPMGEMVRRIERLQQFVRMEDEEAAELLRQDADVLALVWWCFDMDDNAIKLALAEKLAGLPNGVGVHILKQALVCELYSDYFKQGIVLMLSNCGVKPPYTAIFNDKLSDISIKLHEDGGQMSGYLSEILSAALEYTGVDGGEDYRRYMTAMWSCFAGLYCMRVRPGKSQNGWTAALIYATCGMMGIKVSLRRLALDFGTSVITVKKRSMEIIDAVGDGALGG